MTFQHQSGPLVNYGRISVIRMRLQTAVGSFLATEYTSRAAWHHRIEFILVFETNFRRIILTSGPLVKTERQNTDSEKAPNNAQNIIL